MAKSHQQVSLRHDCGRDDKFIVLDKFQHFKFQKRRTQSFGLYESSEFVL